MLLGAKKQFVNALIVTICSIKLLNYLQLNLTVIRRTRGTEILIFMKSSMLNMFYFVFSQKQMVLQTSTCMCVQPF